MTFSGAGHLVFLCANMDQSILQSRVCIIRYTIFHTPAGVALAAICLLNLHVETYRELIAKFC